MKHVCERVFSWHEIIIWHIIYVKTTNFSDNNQYKSQCTYLKWFVSHILERDSLVDAKFLKSSPDICSVSKSLKNVSALSFSETNVLELDFEISLVFLLKDSRTLSSWRIIMHKLLKLPLKWVNSDSWSWSIACTDDPIENSILWSFEKLV